MRYEHGFLLCCKNLYKDVCFIYFDVKRREITLDTGVGARALLIRLYSELWTLGLACSSELCCAAFLSHFII